MHVPQKQVSDICRLAQHGGERLCAVELDPVQARDADIERRVVHEQLDRVRFRILQTLRKPFAALVTVEAGATPLVQGIEENVPQQKTATMTDRDQAAAVCCNHYRDCIRATLNARPHRP